MQIIYIFIKINNKFTGKMFRDILISKQIPISKPSSKQNQVEYLKITPQKARKLCILN
jgi:hypothetical protein